MAVLPRTHRLAARSRVLPSDLAADAIITMRPGYGVRTLTDDLLRAAGLPLAYAFESDEMTTIAGLVGAGLGVSVLPAGAAAGSDTVEVGLRAPGAVRVISLAWSAQRVATAPVAALRTHLVTHGPTALGAAR